MCIIHIKLQYKIDLLFFAGFFYVHGLMKSRNNVKEIAIISLITSLLAVQV